MKDRTKPPLIVNDMLITPSLANTWQLQPRLLELFAGDENADSLMEPAGNKKKKKKKKKTKKKKKGKTFNIFESEPDFESPNGRTITINTKDLKVLKGSMVGVFMVNLTQASMMGPHWNPWACEISIVLKGTGMVRVLRSSISSSSSECKNSRFKVDEGDIFAVPRLHSMAQMSFNNDSFVFVGFTSSAKNNEPQFLAGESSALRMLDREVLAASFNVSNVVIDGILGARKEAVTLGCPSCAEGELEKLEEEKRKQEEEEEKKPQPQPQPEPKPEPKPEPQPEPEPKPEPQPEPKPEPEEPQPPKETERRDEERKTEEEEAKKEAEERWKHEEEEEKKWWPPQPQQPTTPTYGKRRRNDK